MAGLLTYPRDSRLLRAIRSNDIVRILLMQDLQQRVLFRTYTGFPFDAISKATLCLIATITAAKV